ncbi:MAG: 30S ribosomal protein S16 [Chloroflexota bacterium]
MSLKIRLSRVGAKKQASYRIVVADSRAPRDGKAIAILGHYNPLTDPYTLKVDQDKVLSWLKHGAQPSETARGLLTKAGVIAPFQEFVKATQAKAKADKAAAAAKPARAPRAERTGEPRLARPVKKEVAEASASTQAAPAPAKAKVRAKGGAAARAKASAKGSGGKGSGSGKK